MRVIPLPGRLIRDPGRMHESFWPCGRVLLRLLSRNCVKELACVLPHGHAGAHDFVPIVRMAPIIDIEPAGAIL